MTGQKIASTTVFPLPRPQSAMQRGDKLEMRWTDSLWRSLPHLQCCSPSTPLCVNLSKMELRERSDMNDSQYSYHLNEGLCRRHEFLIGRGISNGRMDASCKGDITWGGCLSKCPDVTIFFQGSLWCNSTTLRCQEALLWNQGRSKLSIHLLQQHRRVRTWFDSFWVPLPLSVLFPPAWYR